MAAFDELAQLGIYFAMYVRPAPYTSLQSACQSGGPRPGGRRPGRAVTVVGSPNFFSRIRDLNAE